MPGRRAAKDLGASRKQERSMSAQNEHHAERSPPADGEHRVVMEAAIRAPSFATFVAAYVACQLPYARERLPDGGVEYHKTQAIADPRLAVLLPSSMRAVEYTETCRVRDGAMFTHTDVDVAGIARVRTHVAYRPDDAAGTVNVTATVTFADLPSAAIVPILRALARKEFDRRRADERAAIEIAATSAGA